MDLLVCGKIELSPDNDNDPPNRNHIERVCKTVTSATATEPCALSPSGPGMCSQAASSVNYGEIFPRFLY